MEPKLYIDIPGTGYRPEETIAGKILWTLDQPPEIVRLTLGWWTEGRGTKDSRIEASREWQTQLLAGEEDFALALPPSPYSFSGTLITLKWALELSVRKGRETAIEHIVVSPTGEPVELPRIDESGSKPFSLFSRR